MKSYQEQKMDVLSKLPRIKESGIWRYDAAVYSFLHQIMHSECGEYDHYIVMDEMLNYYAPLLNKLQNELFEYQKYAPTPEHMKPLVKCYLDKYDPEYNRNNTLFKRFFKNLKFWFTTRHPSIIDK